MNNMDYSFLFGGSSNSDGSNGLYSSLSDLYSIRTGTYKKLVSAYYKKTEGDGEDGTSATPWKGANTSSGTTELAKSAERIKSAYSSLADAAGAFDDKNLFAQKSFTTKAEDGTETTVKDYDREAIYNAAKKFVDSYNSFVTEAGKSSIDSVARQGSNLVTSTAVNSKLLSRTGITIDRDNKLSIDEAAFKKADISTIKTLFSGNSSFVSGVATKAGMISSTAGSEAELHKIYGSNAKTSGGLDSGNLLDSFL